MRNPLCGVSVFWQSLWIRVSTHKKNVAIALQHHVFFIPLPCTLQALVLNSRTRRWTTLALNSGSRLPWENKSNQMPKDVNLALPEKLPSEIVSLLRFDNWVYFIDRGQCQTLCHRNSSGMPRWALHACTILYKHNRRPLVVCGVFATWHIKGWNLIV